MRTSSRISRIYASIYIFLILQSYSVVRLDAAHLRGDVHIFDQLVRHSTAQCVFFFAQVVAVGAAVGLVMHLEGAVPLK